MEIRRRVEPVAGESLVDRVARARGVSREDPAVLANLDDPASLSDIDRAVDALQGAIREGAVIAIETDHDVDGVSSHAVIKTTLDGLGARTASFIGHRLREGYGLSDGVCERILASDPLPSLVVTADNGSSDEARIARLAEAGIATVVTDHHDLPPAGPPASAVACVTPRHPEGAYPDPFIAGVMVSWLLMVKLVRAEAERGNPAAKDFRVTELLDYVALGTVADCVDLRSTNNRAVVNAGLDRMNRGSRPCYRVAAPTMTRGRPWRADTLAFQLGPRINARGRVDEAMAGVHFLISANETEAKKWLDVLETANAERKTVEAEMKETAMGLVEPEVRAGRYGLFIHLPEGHSGVHGIVASRIVEATGRPVVVASPQTGRPGVLTASARTAGAANIHAAFEAMATDPELAEAIHKWGGHPAAGGITFDEAALPRMREAFDAAVRAQWADPAPGEPFRESDGPIEPDEVRLETFDALEALAPFGQGSPAPQFELRGVVQNVKAFGAKGSEETPHRRLRLQLASSDGSTSKRFANAVAFNAESPITDLEEGDAIVALVRLQDSVFRETRNLDLLVEVAHPVEATAEPA